MLNIVLIEFDPQHTLLEHSLSLCGFNCLKLSDNEDFLAQLKHYSADVLMFNVTTPSTKLIADLQRLNKQSPLPVVIFATDEQTDTIQHVINAGVSSFIVCDTVPIVRLNSIIHVAIARFKQQQALKTALEEARVQLEDRKQIDRAKAILIQTRNFTENEAYHTLRKLAMDRNITLGEMAKNVIAMAELLK
ncbi:MAG: ANTAR domain-containing protein [Methylovulum sp.]|jgi:response regulator NasT|nr:ANTAR domain-containing protein [Methylovulum sp.]MCF7999778.1 ANTAR domain-containing protein [Methylovulum sp.]